jgi:hypothetical protein
MSLPFQYYFRQHKTQSSYCLLLWLERFTEIHSRINKPPCSKHNLVQAARTPTQRTQLKATGINGDRHIQEYQHKSMLSVQHWYKFNVIGKKQPRKHVTIASFLPSIFLGQVKCCEMVTANDETTIGNITSKLSFFVNLFISNQNYIRFYKPICCDSVWREEAYPKISPH